MRDERRFAESGFAHFLWGNYDGTQNRPEDVNPLLRFIYRYVVDGGAVLMPLSSPYGPGAVWARASVDWSPPGSGLDLGVEVLYLSKNSAANLIDTPYYTGLEETAGAPRVDYLSVALPFRWRRDALVLSAQPSVMAMDGDAWIELACGVGFRLGQGRP
mgnify:CR=1 FL=1